MGLKRAKGPDDEPTLTCPKCGAEDEILLYQQENAYYWVLDIDSDGWADTGDAYPKYWNVGDTHFICRSCDATLMESDILRNGVPIREEMEDALDDNTCLGKPKS